MNNIRYERGEITTSFTEIGKNSKRMLQIVTYNELGILEEMDKFLET